MAEAFPQGVEPAERITLTIPVSPGAYAVLQVHRPMTEEQWRRMHAVLDAMKPGIVYDPPSTPEGN